MGLNLSNAEINDFIQNRRLYKSFILAAVNVRIEKEANIAVELSDKEQEFYDLIMSDLKKIDDFLNNLSIKIMWNNHDINGYSVFWSGRDWTRVVHITKNGNGMDSGFFWTISAAKIPNEDKVLYSHINTNGSIKEISEAFYSINENQAKPSRLRAGCSIS